MDIDHLILIVVTKRQFRQKYTWTKRLLRQVDNSVKKTKKTKTKKAPPLAQRQI